MKKQILKGDKARLKLKAGVDKLADTVVTTLGPRGHNVALDVVMGVAKVVHDGVTVAKSIWLEDPFENMGAQLVKQAAENTNEEAGDGTTTATLLAQAIITEGLKITTKEPGSVIKATNSMKLRKQIEVAADMVMDEVRKLAKKVTTHKEKEHVATIASQDPELGRLIADAVKIVGNTGVITVDDAMGFETTLEKKEGMEIGKGFEFPYFINNEAKGTCELENPGIIVTDLPILDLDKMIDFFGAFLKTRQDLLIISPEINQLAHIGLSMNKDRGALKPLAIGPPGYGPHREEMMKDIAVATGATFVDKANFADCSEITMEHVGYADRIFATNKSTTIIGGMGNKKDIADRVKLIKSRLANKPSSYEKLKLKERLGKLTSGAVVIHVGGATETELEERRLRIEDAVNATKAAIEDGIVPGGGTIFLRARKVLEDVDTDGARLLYKALEQPIRMVLKNAGEDADDILAKLEEMKPEMGFDVVAEEFVDMMAAGIVDPAKVTLSALDNAVSVAVMVLTTEALVTELPNDKNKERQISKEV